MGRGRRRIPWAIRAPAYHHLFQDSLECAVSLVEPALCSDVMAAVREVLANCTEHAYGGDREKNVTLLMFLSVDELALSITDTGPGFTPESWSRESAKEELERLAIIGAERGRGVLMMHTLADTVLFRRQGRQVILKFDRRRYREGV